MNQKNESKKRKRKDGFIEHMDQNMFIKPSFLSRRIIHDQIKSLEVYSLLHAFGASSPILAGPATDVFKSGRDFILSVGIWDDLDNHGAMEDMWIFIQTSVFVYILARAITSWDLKLEALHLSNLHLGRDRMFTWVVKRSAPWSTGERKTQMKFSIMDNFIN